MVDSVERLRSTLAHEMCHVAAWSLDREFHPHHGAAFWRWAGKISAAVQVREDKSLFVVQVAEGKISVLVQVA